MTTPTGEELIAKHAEMYPNDYEVMLRIGMEERVARIEKEAVRAVIAGHGGLVDQCRQRTASIGFDLMTIREAKDDETRNAALDRLTDHVNRIDNILTAALEESRK